MRVGQTSHKRPVRLPDAAALARIALQHQQDGRFEDRGQAAWVHPVDTCKLRVQPN